MRTICSALTASRPSMPAAERVASPTKNTRFNYLRLMASWRQKITAVWRLTGVLVTRMHMSPLRSKRSISRRRWNLIKTQYFFLVDNFPSGCNISHRRPLFLFCPHDLFRKSTFERDSNLEMSISCEVFHLRTRKRPAAECALDRPTRMSDRVTAAHAYLWSLSG